jgi:hypothetical protein
MPVTMRLECLRLTELQSILKSRRIKSSGRKAELAARLVASVSGHEAERLAGARRYFATEAGKRAIVAYEERKERARASMRSEVLIALLKKDVRSAGRIVAEFESRRIFKRGMGIDWREGMPEQYIETAKWLVNHTYDDLPYPENIRRQIGAELGLVELIDDKFCTSGLLTATGGEFSCPLLEAFLRNEPCGWFAPTDDDANDEESDVRAEMKFAPGELAWMYAHTRMTEASCTVALRDILRFRGDDFFRGVEILLGGDRACRMCNNGQLKFRWSEVDRLPKLPRHWGCTCCYIAWSRD